MLPHSSATQAKLFGKSLARMKFPVCEDLQQLLGPHERLPGPATHARLGAVEHARDIFTMCVDDERRDARGENDDSRLIRQALPGKN